MIKKIEYERNYRVKKNPPAKCVEEIKSQKISINVYLKYTNIEPLKHY